MNYRERLYSQYRASTGSATPSPAALQAQASYFQQILAPWLPPSKESSIFEIGCGQGVVLYALMKEGYSSVQGMDQDAEHVSAAKRLGVMNVSSGDAVEFLKQKSAAFDAVIAIDVLEHFTKDEIFPILDTVARALKPGGILIWRAPNADGLFAGRLRYGDLTHEIAFTPSSAEQLMRVAGFMDIQVLGEPIIVTGVRSLLRRVLWEALKPLVKVYLFAESYPERPPLLTANLIVKARKPQSAPIIS